MSSKADGKGQFVVVAQALLAGTAKHFTGTTSVSFMGSTFTPADITTKLTEIVTLRSGVDTARAAVMAKVATEKASMPSLRAFVQAYEAFLKVNFGGSPDVLADFGIKPKTPATPTAATKAGAVVKRAATREARHTMGSVQKSKVHGDVTGVTVTPVVSEPTPTVTPAGSATSGAAPASPTVPRST
jgi:hypothetical protein